MTTFLAKTLTETAKTVSIPSAIAAELLPLLEQVVADQAQTMAELTQLPNSCDVGTPSNRTGITEQQLKDAPEFSESRASLSTCSVASLRLVCGVGVPKSALSRRA